MKNINKFIFYFLLAALPFFQACNNNDDNAIPQGEYATGVVIANEGNFGGSNASVSFYNRSTGEASNNIFEAENERPLGDVLQSVHFHGTRGFLVVNNSNKVEVIEGATFKSVGVIEDELANPRYMTVAGSKGYITNWGNFDSNFQLDQSYVLVVDLDNLSALKKINTDNGSENIVLHNNKLFVSNSFTNTLSIIDIPSETVVATLELSDAPSGIEVGGDGLVWVICRGSWQGNNGKLFAISPINNSISKEIELGINTSGKIARSSNGERLFYTSGKSIYQIPVAATEAPASAFITADQMTGSVYGIGVDPQTNIIYASDAVGFQGSGQVYRYSAEGEPIDNFTAGIGPNGFWFK